MFFKKHLNKFHLPLPFILTSIFDFIILFNALNLVKGIFLLFIVKIMKMICKDELNYHLLLKIHKILMAMLYNLLAISIILIIKVVAVT